MSTLQATRDGATLVGQRRGTPGKPRLALIHSLAMSGVFWDRVVAEIEGEFDILTYDARGHGASTATPGPYSVEQFADDLAALFDAAGWDRAIVAGCSMGGTIAITFAAHYGARVQALALIDTTAWYGADAPTAWHGRAVQAAEKGLASLMGFQATRWFSDSFRERHPDILQQMTDIFVANDVAAYGATCDMLGAADLRAAINGWRKPTAIIVGVEDYATPLEMSQALHDLLPGSTLDVIEDGRHLTPVQCPERIATLLRGLAARL